MKNKNDGGPAFPGIKYEDQLGNVKIYIDDNGNHIPIIYGGMDYPLQ